MSHPRLHIICGFCGCNEGHTFSVEETDPVEIGPDVNIECHNCGMITSLLELDMEKTND